MEVKYRSANGRFEVLFDVKGQDTLFKELASFQEVFEIPNKVRIAGKDVDGKDIQYKVRVVEGNEYFELAYTGGDKDLFGYRKHFGCSKENKGGLFPKWNVKEEDKDKYENGGGGWFRWKGGKRNEPSSNDEKPAF